MKKLSSDLKNNYITIQSWMVEELELRGNTLMIFALIYGFSQVGNQVCTCGDEYMAAWINSSTRCVLNCKKELLDKKLIEKVELKGDSRVSGYRAERLKIPEESSGVQLKTPEESSGIIPKIGEESSPIVDKSDAKAVICEESSGIIPKLGEESSYIPRIIPEESSYKKELYPNIFPKIPEHFSRASYDNNNYNTSDDNYINNLTVRTRKEWETVIVDNCNVETLRQSCIASFGTDKAVDIVLNCLLDYLAKGSSAVVSGESFNFLQVAEKLDKLHSKDMCLLTQNIYERDDRVPPKNWKRKRISNLRNYLLKSIINTAEAE